MIGKILCLKAACDLLYADDILTKIVPVTMIISYPYFIYCMIFGNWLVHKYKFCLFINDVIFDVWVQSDEK